MSDSAFKTAPYSGFTTEQLRTSVKDCSNPSIEAEIARREAVAAGDVSKMTDGERRRFHTTGKAR